MSPAAERGKHARERFEPSHTPASLVRALPVWQSVSGIQDGETFGITAGIRPS